MQIYLKGIKVKKYLEDMKPVFTVMFGLTIVLLFLISLKLLFEFQTNKERYYEEKIKTILVSRVLVAADAIYVSKLDRDEVPECDKYSKAFYYKAVYDVNTPEETTNDTAFFCYNSTEDWLIVEDMRPYQKRHWGN